VCVIVCMCVSYYYSSVGCVVCMCETKRTCWVSYQDNWALGGDSTMCVWPVINESMGCVCLGCVFSRRSYGFISCLYMGDCIVVEL
jgi:hypothetical protein